MKSAIPPSLRLVAAFSEKFAACLVLLAGFLLASCTIKPEAREKSGGSQPVNKVAGLNNSELDASQASGIVKADEFNNQATGTEAPVNGGELVMQLRSEPNTLNVLVPDAYSMYIDNYLYDGLLRQNPETYKWEPALA